ncbi:twin-arginine translocation signal domain-containing protein [Phreatobacter sp.]|uniref:twin-arginine translocation signal domain-containing protein n=1 Tax=Phreatobacter sp. TaxID=1966341 RepID=UPI003F6F05F3
MPTDTKQTKRPTPPDADRAVAGRRDFLKAMTGASAVAAAAVVGAEPAEAQAQTPQRESREERIKARYQANSAHVQAFYRTNRY